MAETKKEPPKLAPKPQPRPAAPAPAPAPAKSAPAPAKSAPATSGAKSGNGVAAQAAQAAQAPKPIQVGATGAAPPKSPPARSQRANPPRYEVVFTPKEIQLKVKIKLEPQAGVTKEQAQRVRERASAAFTSRFDRKFAFVEGKQTRLLRCTAELVDDGEHAVVKLHPGGHASDGDHRVDWYVDGSDADYAHALGHQLGLDEDSHTDHSLLGNYRREGADQAELKLRHGRSIGHDIGEAAHHSLKLKAGFERKGGDPVRVHLARLVEEGKLDITGKQIALLDAIAQVETGGKIGCVDTTDNQIVSIGFKQVVLGHGSLEMIMKQAPAGFAKHGLALDTSKKYPARKDWDNHSPSQIVGCEDEEELRRPEWANRFYEASMEPDVIKAMCVLALGEVTQKVGSAVEAHAHGVDLFSDVTAQAWLLETYNNRKTFMAVAIKKAVAAGAKTAAGRDAFLDILAKAIIDTYVEQEPLIWYYKAKQNRRLTPQQDAALLEAKKREYEPIGRHKGTNITTKIKRNIPIPKVGKDSVHELHATTRALIEQTQFATWTPYAPAAGAHATILTAGARLESATWPNLSTAGKASDPTTPTTPTTTTQPTTQPTHDRDPAAH